MVGLNFHTVLLVKEVTQIKQHSPLYISLQNSSHTEICKLVEGVRARS